VAPLSRTSHRAKACANGCSNTCTSTGVARYRATDGAAGGATRCATQWSRRGRRRTRSLAGISCTPFRFGLGQRGAARGDKSECDRNQNAESHEYLLSVTTLFNSTQLSPGAGGEVRVRMILHSNSFNAAEPRMF